MRKLTGIVLAVLGGRQAVRQALEAAILEALEDLEDEALEAPKPKRRKGPEAEKAHAVQPPQAEAEAEAPKPKRRKGPEADSGPEVRKLVQALADLGPHLGKSPSGKPMEEILTNRGESLAKHALPGHAKTVLAAVLEYLRGFPLEEAKREALRGFRDLAEVAGVGHLLRPKL